MGGVSGTRGGGGGDRLETIPGVTHQLREGPICSGRRAK